MSSYYHFNAHQQHPTPATAAAVSHSHHGGRNRRAPRLSVSQNPQKQFRGVRSMKELNETANVQSFRMKYEAGRSFDLEDDMEFCPGLLTDSDVSRLRRPRLAAIGWHSLGHIRTDLSNSLCRYTAHPRSGRRWQATRRKARRPSNPPKSLRPSTSTRHLPPSSLRGTKVTTSRP